MLYGSLTTWLMASILVLCFDSRVADAQEVERLNEVNFQDYVNDGRLHLVDFYSPYCAYCQRILPDFEATWTHHAAELERWNVTMAKVDCVASGDFCFEEQVDIYPSLRLYGPAGFIKNFPRDVRETEENLIEFLKRESQVATNYDTGDAPSKSMLTTALDFQKTLKDSTLERPVLYSVWPSTNRNTMDGSIVFIDCDNCIPFQKVWNRVTRELDAQGIQTGHIGCEDNASLCTKYGFGDLNEQLPTFADRSPGLLLILPTGKGNQVFSYKSPVTTNSDNYIDFVNRMVHNNELKEINENDILNLINKKIDYLEDNKSSELSPKLHLVLLYDQNQSEWQEIAESLLQPLSETSVYFHKSQCNLAKLTQEIYHEQYSLLTKNGNPSANNKIFSWDSSSIKALSGLPTLFVFREGEKRISVYPRRSLNDVDSIKKWLSVLSRPLVDDISINNIGKLLDFQPDTYSTLVVQLVNTSTTLSGTFSHDYIRNLMDVTWKYDNERVRNMNRNKDNNVLFTYLDISKKREVLNENRLYVKPYTDYKNGDILVIDKRTKMVYDKGPNNKPLHGDHPDSLVEALVALNFPKSSRNKMKGGRLALSPFPEALRFLDMIHRYGLKGYAISIVILLLILNIRTIYWLMQLSPKASTPTKLRKTY